REGPVPEDQRHEAFTSKPPGQRIAIAAAGPIANFLFAIAAYWLLSVVGVTTVATIAGDVSEGSIADRMGLRSGMEIYQVDGRDVDSWRDINMRLLERAGEDGEVTFTVSDGGNRQTLATSLGGWRLPDDNPDPLGEFGLSPLRPDVPAEIGQVVPDSPAADAGLQEGDRVVAVNGEPVEDWFALVEIIQQSAEKTLELQVQRSGEEVALEVIPGSREVEGVEQGYVGAGAVEVSWPDDMLREVRYGPLAAVPNAVSETWADTRLTLVAIQKMITGLLSPTNLSGPITIARVAEASVSSGFEDFIQFLAYLSVSLGILNLLPIPVLDGGHIVYYTIEAIRRRPLSEQVQALGLRIGMAMILTLMVFALYNDLMRL
ncbi:MAG: RIP metalloprotease RseP, partial [Marinobacter sp.]